MGDLLSGFSFDNTATIFIFKFSSLIIALIGLLICLFGRKIIKPIISILCTTNGLFLGAFLCILLNLSNDTLITVITLGCMVLGLIVSIFYRKFMTNLTLSWFTGLFAFSFIFGLMHNNIVTAALISIPVGIGVFISMLILFKRNYSKMVIINTALFGSVLFSYFIFITFKYNGLFDYLGSQALFGATNLYNNTLGRYYAIQGASENRVWMLVAIVLFTVSCGFQLKKSTKSSVADKGKRIEKSSVIENLKSTKPNITQKLRPKRISNTTAPLDKYFILGIFAAIILSLISIFFDINAMLKIAGVAFSLSLAMELVELTNLKIPKSFRDACLMLTAICCTIGVLQVLFTTGIIYHVLEFALAAACVYGLFRKHNYNTDGEYILSLTGIAAALNFVLLLILYRHFSLITLAVLFVCFIDSYLLITNKQASGSHSQGKHLA